MSVTVTIHRCYDCPSFQTICTCRFCILEEREMEDADGFKPPPQWCPLRKVPTFPKVAVTNEEPTKENIP